MRRSLFRKKHLSHAQQVIKTGITVVIINILILTAVFFIAGSEIGKIIYGDFAYAVNSGGVVDDVEYKSEVVINNEDKEVIEEDWISPKVGEHYGYITCEKIELNVPLYYGDSSKILSKGVGQSVKSVFPGQKGTILVGGHDTTYFSALSKLEDNYQDCVIKVDTVYGAFEYKITGQEIITGSDYEIKADKEQLVLYTCYPFGDISDDRSQKIIFSCDKITGPVLSGGSVDE